MSLAIVFSKQKKKYGPIATGLVEASKEMGFSVCTHGDDLRGFKYIIIFDSRIERLQGPIQCDKSALVGWWMNDLRPVEDLPSVSIDPQIDCIFLCNTSLIDQYKERFDRPVFYMPQPGHVFNEKSKRSRMQNVSFIGSLLHPAYHYNRPRYLSVASRYGLMHIFEQGTTYEMSDIYNKTPINLSISLPYPGYTSNRLYNILAAEGFAMALYFPGIEKLFDNHKHLVWFYNEKELEGMLRYYLDRPEKREAITRAGWQLWKEKHTPQKRISNMLDIMKGKTQEFYGYIN